MATYRCRTCGKTKNDNLVSQMAAFGRCRPTNSSASISQHSWTKISND